MQKANRKYLYYFLAIFTVIVGAQYLLPKPVNWNRTYLSKDKAPLGCYAIHELVNGVYAEKVTNNTQTFYSLKEKTDSASSIILINDNFNFNKSDLSSLYQMINKGAKVFLAANEFNGSLVDSLHIETTYSSFEYFSSIDSLMNKPGEALVPLSKSTGKEKYVYPRLTWTSYFENFDTTRFKVLAINDKQKACFIRTTIGKGQLYLMSVPDVFGNIFIVNHKNRNFVYFLLSHTKNKSLIWDEYYKTYNVSNYSPIRFILESDALYAAYLLLIFSIIIYMITEGRRRQRPIPVTEPNTNSTLEFINVIAHVYYGSKNHQNIATEKIRYFYDEIRRKFNLNTNEINTLFLEDISELSGIKKTQVEQLFNYCEKIKQRESIDELELIELERQISNFNKNSLR